MAIDFGEARTGVAVSDESLTLAGDSWVIHKKSTKDTAQVITAEALKRGVSRIVVGYPRNMNGSIGPRAEKSGQFAELLRSLCDIEIELWDERMTTMSANRILNDTGRYGKKRKNMVDAVAASLILENYLAFISNIPLESQ
jgi:putative Holliday junction resolvase